MLLNKKKYGLPLFFLSIAITTASMLYAASILTTPRLPNANSQPLCYSLHTRDDIRELFDNGFSHAHNSILIVVFSFTDEKLASRLRECASRGISVTVITDKRNVSLATSLLGNHITIISRSMSGLMHQKIIVIDEVITFIGSANMTTESLRMHDNVVIGIHDKKLSQHITARALAVTHPPSYLIPFSRSYCIAGQDIEYYSLPEDRMDALKKIIDIIDSSTTSLKIAMFTWTHQDIASAVIAAKKRGVAVDVVIDYHSSRGASKKIVNMLRSAGIDVMTNRGSSLLHHKFLVADNRTFVNGSTNWTKAAFSNNDECFLVIKEISPSQWSFIEKLWKITTSEALYQGR